MIIQYVESNVKIKNIELGDVILDKINEHKAYMIVENSRGKYCTLDLQTNEISEDSYNTIKALICTEFTLKLIESNEDDKFKLIKSNKLKLILED